MFSLIVYPFPAPIEGFQEKLEVVSKETDLSPYDLRQKFIGIAPTLLKRIADKDASLSLVNAISGIGIPIVTISDQAVREAPQALLAKSVTVEENRFQVKGKRNENIEVAVEEPLFIVLGALAVKASDQLRTMRQSFVDQRDPDEDERLTRLSHHCPVADIYLTQRKQTIRIMGNSFNYSGMGKHRTDSVALNFVTLISLLRKRAKQSVVELGFGLSTIPGCVPSNVDEPGQESKNLKVFSRYSQLMNCCYQAGLYSQTERAKIVAEQAHLSDQETSKGAQNRSKDELMAPPPELITSTGGRYALLVRPDRWLFRIKSIGPIWLSLPLCFLIITSTIVGSFTLSQTWIATAVVMMGTVLLIHGVDLIARKRLIENTPTSNIRSMAMGFVELVGKARQKYLLKLPYLLADCVYYRYRIMERNQANNPSVWTRVGGGDSGPVPFFLEDDTGRVLIDPRDAIIEGIVHEELASTALLHLGGVPVPPHQKVILDYIPEGFTTYIYGIARPVVGDVHKGKKLLVERLRDIKRSKELLQQYDKNGDGRIDQEEWAQAISSVQQEIDEERLQADYGQGSAEQVVIASGNRPGRFYIRGDKEEAVIKSLHYRSLVTVIVAGSVFVVGFVYLLYSLT